MKIECAYDSELLASKLSFTDVGYEYTVVVRETKPDKLFKFIIDVTEDARACFIAQHSNEYA